MYVNFTSIISKSSMSPHCKAFEPSFYKTSKVPWLRSLHNAILCHPFPKKHSEHLENQPSVPATPEANALLACLVMCAWASHWAHHRIIASSLFLSLQSSEWSLQCTKVAHRFKGYLGCTKMHSLMHLVKKWKFIIVCCGKFMDLYSHIRYTFLELRSESEPCKLFHVFGKGVLHHMRDERAWDTQDGALCSLVWRSWSRQELCTNHTLTFRQFTMLECWRHVLSHCLKSELWSRMWIPGGDAPNYQELSGGFRRYMEVSELSFSQSSGKSMATQWGLDSGRHLDTSISVGAPGSPRNHGVVSWLSGTSLQHPTTSGLRCLSWEEGWIWDAIKVQTQSGLDWWKMGVIGKQ